MGKAWKQERLICALNPKIIGWANYNHSVVSSEIFHKLDSIIWGMLWHWAKRRHPEKSKQWIADKYWHSAGKREWVFSDDTEQLRFLSDTKIVRHIKLKLGVKKLKSIAKNGWDKVKNICKPETMTMTNNCCPNKGLSEA